MDKNIFTTFIARKTNLFFAIVAMFATVMASSCSEHAEDIDSIHYPVAVGNILLSNNEIVPLEKYDSTMNAIGVVIHTKSDSIWVVSTKELGKIEYLDTLMTVSGVSSEEDALCGRENTAALLLADKPSPAASAAFNYQSPVYGWFLPSIGELRILATNYKTVSSVMELIGGDPFLESQYLSSTQDGSSTETEQIYARCITLQSGMLSSIYKMDKAEVRPVLRMKLPQVY